MLANSSANDASVSPSTVVIAAGQSTGSFTVKGLAAGPSTISATAAGYASASALITVAAGAPVTGTGSVTTVEVLGAIPAAQAVNGLGFNVSPGNDWELKMAAAAGATHARFQCGWSAMKTRQRLQKILPPQFNSPWNQIARQVSLHRLRMGFIPRFWLRTGHPFTRFCG